MSSFCETVIFRVCADNNPAGVKVVVQSLGFPQKFRTEQDIFGAGLFPDGCSITYGNGGFYNHDSIWIVLHHQTDYRFHGRCVKMLGDGIVIGRGSDDHKICIGVSQLCVQCGSQIQILLGQILFNIVILNGGNTPVNQIYFFRHNVYRVDFMMYGQKGSYG